EFFQVSSFTIMDGKRACDPARGEMLHQREEIGQVSPGDPLLVEREDVGTGLGVNQVVRVLNALGDALERSQRADVVACDEGFELLVGDVGVDGHLADSRPFHYWPISKGSRATNRKLPPKIATESIQKIIIRRHLLRSHFHAHRAQVPFLGTSSTSNLWL